MLSRINNLSGLISFWYSVRKHDVIGYFERQLFYKTQEKLWPDGLFDTKFKLLPKFELRVCR